MKAPIARREFIALAGAATVWQAAAHAQPAGVPRRIGVLMNNNPSDAIWQSYVTSLIDTLAKLGWKQDQAARIEVRWSNGDPRLIRSYADELVGMAPDVLVSSSTANLDALRRATRTVPIVFLQVSDPIAQGYVQNLARPGGNITGFTAFEFSTGAKWLDLLRQVAPKTERVVTLYNPRTAPQSALFARAIETAASPLGLDTSTALVHDDAELEAAIVRAASQPNGGMVFTTDSFVLARSKQVVALLNRHRLPAISGASRRFASDGGLMCYTPDFVEQFKQAAQYVDRILKGTHAGDLPIQQPTKFWFVINRSAARTLGLDIPEKLLVTADEVIE